MAEGRRGWKGWVFAVVAVLFWYFAAHVVRDVATASALRWADSGKNAEARGALRDWSRGLARCGTERGGRLPSSTVAVPEELGRVRNKQYQSSPTDWGDEGFACAGFSPSAPQSFQYRWVLSSPTEGTAIARADYGVDQFRLEARVSCRGVRCEAAPVPKITTKLESVLVPSEKPSWSVPLYQLCALVGLGWLLYQAFVVSIGWGFAVLLLPCSSFLFASSHWREAKQPALLFWISNALVVLTSLWGPVLAPDDVRPAVEKEAATSVETLPAATPAVAAPALPVAPPIPSAGPLPAFDGTVVDLSSVMGRARKLANEWQADATLLGIEATAQSGKIQPQLGGKAKLTFGPSPFGAETNPKRTGMFVVTYDKTGIHGAPQPGKLGAALPEPMCSPEAVLLRVSDWGTGALQLRYGVDPAARPSWLVSPAGDPKQLRIFEPQACAPRGIQVGRPR